MLAKLTSLAATKLARDEKVPGKAESASSKSTPAAPDNVVGIFELGDLPKIQAVLGEVDDPVYKVRDQLLGQIFVAAPDTAIAACMLSHLLFTQCCALLLLRRTTSGPCTSLQSMATFI
jgi:hypothetical protein